MEPKSIKMYMDYPLDSDVILSVGMTLCTDNGKFKILQKKGKGVYHRNIVGDVKEGYAPKLSTADEWMRHTLIVEKV